MTKARDIADRKLDGENLEFGDNDKAIFGAGSDLQIYHDGANSFIKDTGTGNLSLLGSASINLINADSSKFMARFTDSGSNQFYFNGFEKLATTATGVDVTGTVTADGLTVDQSGTNVAVSFNNTNSDFTTTTSSALRLGVTYSVGSQYGEIRVAENSADTSSTNMLFYPKSNQLAMKLNNNNDISFYEDTGTTPKFFWDASAERLGLGTTTPSVELEVVDTTGTSLIRASGDAGGTTVTAQMAGSISGYGVFGTLTNHPTVFFANNAEKARIDTSGNLLVGTTNADIGGSVTGIKLAQSGAFYASTDETSTLFSQTLYADRRGTNNQGDILALGLNGYIKASIGVIGTSGSSNDGGIIFNTIEGNANKTERMRIEASGRVGIGTSAPQQRFQVDGDPIGTYTQGFTSQLGLQRSSADSTGPRAHYEFRNPNGLVGSISTSSSSTSFNTSSDYRLKENVVALDGAADRLAQIPVHRFNFIADPDTTVDGFLAHEVQAIVPEAVTGEKDAVDADGNPIHQGIDQSKLVPLLTAALQEALTEIENLKARVAALEGA